MKIIISPTKQMKQEQDFFFPESQPQFLEQTKQILEKLKLLSYEDAKNMWQCNDKLAKENYERLRSADVTSKTSPAIMSYKGLQYQYMAPDLMTLPGLTYLQEHVRILSGFYGMLRPFDGIIPYRLEMQARLEVDNQKNLYAFWGEQLYEALHFEQGPVINLASKEYSKTIVPYLQPTDQLIDVSFGQIVSGKLKIKATLAKMARGEMVRYLAENQVTTLDRIKEFDHPDYLFSDDYSTNQQFVFLYQK